MKKISFLFLMSIVLNSSHAFDCIKYLIPFLKSPTEKTKIKSNQIMLNTHEKVSNFARSQKPNYEAQTSLKMQKKLERLDSLHYKEKFDLVSHKVKTIFRDVELAYLYIRQYDNVVPKLEKIRNIDNAEQFSRALKRQQVDSGFSQYLVEVYSNSKDYDAFLKAITKDHKKQQKTFGRKFDEYNLYREFLEYYTIKGNCNSECIKNSEEVLKSIGIRGEDDFFHQVRGRYRRPSHSMLKAFLENHTLAREVSLKKQTFHELFSLIGDNTVDRAFSGTMDALQYNPIIERNFLKLRFPFKMLFDHRILMRYSPEVSQIVNHTGTLKNQLKQVEKFHEGSDYNLFLTTFARRSDTKSTKKWNQLKDFAKEEKPELFKQMDKSENIAKKQGPLRVSSKNPYISPFIIKVVTVVGCAVIFKHMTTVVSEEMIEITDSESDSSHEVIELENDDEISPSIIELDLNTTQPEEIKSEFQQLIKEDSKSLMELLDEIEASLNSTREKSLP